MAGHTQQCKMSQARKCNASESETHVTECAVSPLQSIAQHMVAASSQMLLLIGGLVQGAVRLKDMH